MSSPAVNDGAQFSANDFYAELVRRNSGLIPAVDQQRLRRANVLIAGCGSVGGAAVEPLVRLGAERLIIAEPNTYELSNLNRQRAGVQDVGANKGLVQARRAKEINPFVAVTVETDGLTTANVCRLVTEADVILDGVDVTTREAIGHKIALHAAACNSGVPVLSGYDVAGRQALVVYDYRRSGMRPLRVRGSLGRVALGPAEFLSTVVPKSAIPFEILNELRGLAAGSPNGFPQLVYAADLFGVLASRAVGEVLAHRPVRQVTIVDAHHALRPARTRARVSVLRLLGLIKVARMIRANRRASA